MYIINVRNNRHHRAQAQAVFHGRILAFTLHGRRRVRFST